MRLEKSGIAVLLLVAVALLELASSAQQTLNWRKDYIQDANGGALAVATPATSDTTAPSTPSGLTSTATGHTEVQLQWSASTDNSGGSQVSGYRLYRGVVLIAVTTATSFIDDTVLPGSEYSYRIAAFDNSGNNSVVSSPFIVTTLSDPAAPSGLTATGVSGSQVNLTWAAAPAADHYVIERRTTGSFAPIDTSSTASYADTSVSADTAYLYRVKAVDAYSQESGYSNVDIATTLVFTDDPLTEGVTVVNAAHMTELRAAVDAVRTAAGLSGASWTDSSLTGVNVKAVHLTELRSNLGAALSALSLDAPMYTDSTITAQSTVIKKAHIAELRQAVK